MGAAQVQGGPTPNPKFAKWNVKGYQADFDFANRYSGQLYEQGTPRGIIAVFTGIRRIPPDVGDQERTQLGRSSGIGGRRTRRRCCRNNRGGLVKPSVA